MKVFFLMAVTWCSVVITLPAQPVSNNSNSVDALLKATFSDVLPGASVAIFSHGKMVFEKSYGISNITTKNKITATSNFNICSLTKQFTALAILQLQQKHLLFLSDKLSRFFPGMDKKVADAITIKQLLTHSSGVVDHYNYTNTNGMQHAHDSDVYNAVKQVDSTYFKPGTQFRYSNTAYCLLALIIEKLSRSSYNTYMRQHIFLPAGMNNTMVWNEDAQIPQEVTGYSFDSASGTFKRSGADEHIFFSTEGDGGIYTSVHDYTNWFKALQSGKIFSKEIVNEARSIEFMIDTLHKTGYGFGWFVNNENAEQEVYHSGDNGGFRTYSFSIPSKDFLVVIFASRDDINLEALVQKILQLYYPSLKPFVPVEALTS